MPRYVILEHNHPSLHWDFMLEVGEVLRSWRLAALPPSAQRIAATATPDHRRLYLDYEGPVSGDRGSVVRWDYGTFTWQKTAIDHLAVRLEGMRLHGTAVLQWIGAVEWALTWVADEDRPGIPSEP